MKSQKLKVLELGGVSITDQGISILAAFPALGSLRFDRHAKFTDAGIKELARCRQLKSLCLSAMPGPTKEGLKQLGTLTNLTSLELLAFQDRLDDEVLASICQAPALKELSLGDAHVTDGGVEHLQKLKHAVSLRLIRTHVTAAGIAGLQLALPSCRIESDFTDDEIKTAIERLNIEDDPCWTLFP